MYSNDVITAPVGIGDVQLALGTDERDLGRLCRHGNVNPWARFKPVVWPELFRRHPWCDPASVGDTPLATGFHATSYESDPDDVATLTPPVFLYERPLGGMASPFRLTDFEGYSRRAVCPLSIEGTQTVQAGQTSLVATLHVDTEVYGYHDQYNLRFSDLFPMERYSQWRLTMAVLPPEGGASDDPLIYFVSEGVVSDTSTGRQVSSTTEGLRRVLTEDSTVRYRAVCMLTDIDTADLPEGWRNGLAPSQISNSHAVSLALDDNGCDRWMFRYLSSGYIPGGDPTQHIAYVSRYNDAEITDETDYGGNIGVVDHCEISGLDWTLWVPSTMLRTFRLDVSQGFVEAKVTAVAEYAYGYDDVSQGGSVDTSTWYSRLETTIVDWTKLNEQTNLTVEESEPTDGYGRISCWLELWNYIYQALNGNLHDRLYLSDDAAPWPRDVTLRLHIRKPGILETVAGTVTLSVGNT